MLTLTIALLLISLSYAHWTETITIEGTVETGELSLGFTKCLIYIGLTNEYTTLEPVEPPEDKWLIYWNKRLLFGIWLDQSPDTVAFKISNAYPCLGSTLCPLKPHSFLFVAKFTNTGTIPVKFDYAEVEKPDWIELKGWLIIVDECKIECENIDTNSLSEKLEKLTERLENSELEEFIEKLKDALECSDNGDSILDEGKFGFIIIRLHIKQSAPESSEGVVVVRLIFKQWNA